MTHKIKQQLSRKVAKQTEIGERCYGKSFKVNIFLIVMNKRITKLEKEFKLPKINIPHIKIPKDIKISIQEDLRRILSDKKRKGWKVIKMAFSFQFSLADIIQIAIASILFLTALFSYLSVKQTEKSRKLELFTKIIIIKK